MEFIKDFIDLFIHLDVHLAEVVRNYGGWTYGILFAIIFAETGLVVTPILPGDSLLFTAGALAALGDLNPYVMCGLLIVAAILGDMVNYAIGKQIGPRAFSGKIPFLKAEYLTRTQEFYKKHGGKTIIYARFIPIIRTFAPFVAGVGTMTYRKFASYNVIGGILWVAIFLFLGFFFGGIPVIRQNFTYVIFAIIFLSILPPIIEIFRGRKTENKIAG